MTRGHILTSIAAIAIIVAAPALAKPGGGGGMGGGHGNAGLGGMGGGHGGGIGNMGGGADVTSQIDSMGTVNATRIHGKSGINASSMGAGNIKLTGIANGMTVVDGGGATVGIVTGFSTKGSSGNIRNVQVTLTNGNVILLSPRSLALNGGVLTTTSLVTNANALNRRVNSQGQFHANPNGLVHASPNSTLASAGVLTLGGLTMGMTVNNSANVAIGTVTQVLTNRSGAVVGIRADLTNGGIVFIPARTLSLNGTIVTTSSPNF